MHESMFEDSAEQFLQALEIDLTDENFRDTPARMMRMYKEVLHGLYVDLDEEIKKLFSTTFSCTSDQMVIVSGMESWSVCPHHMLPVLLKVDLAYIPYGKVVGLSKLPRLVNLLASRPVLQEQLTEDIASAISKALNPAGVIVCARGEHLCMRMRGVKASESVTTTSAIRGLFCSDPSTKAEFFSILDRAK